MTSTGCLVHVDTALNSTPKKNKRLGQVQKAILAALNYEKSKGTEWRDVGSLSYQVVHDIHIWEQGYRPKLTRPTDSQKQSIWRALRLLEKRRIITSRQQRAGSYARIGKKHGGVSHTKWISCTVQSNFDLKQEGRT